MKQFRQPHHAPPQQTIAQTRERLKSELRISTDTALALKSAEALHRGSYSRLRFDDIATMLQEERSLRELSPQERFDRMLAGQL